MKNLKGFVIAIDGPSAAGKSTIGKILAQRYGLIYIDTGAMYRAAAWLAKIENISWSDEEKLVEIVDSKPFKIYMYNNVVKVIINHIDVTDLIRTIDIGSGASQISALPMVKMAMIKKQQKMGESGGIVMDGRDIGTFVFPHADFKFYLDASLETRALRRYNELREKGDEPDLDEVISAMKVRDYNDSNRAIAPLIRAPDAFYINTDDLNIQQVLDIMIKHIEL